MSEKLKRVIPPTKSRRKKGIAIDDSPPLPGTEDLGPFSQLQAKLEAADAGEIPQPSGLPRLSDFRPPPISSLLDPGRETLLPGKYLLARHYEIGRRLWLGHGHKEIAEALGFSVEHISHLSRDPKILAEIERLKDAAFERTVSQHLKDLGPEAMGVIEDTIRGDLPVKPEKRLEAAQWVVEKVDGKAAQKIEQKHSSLDRFMELLSGMKEAGETLDVTPQRQLPEARSAEGESAPVTDSDIAPQPEAPETDWGAYLDKKLPR